MRCQADGCFFPDTVDGPNRGAKDQNGPRIDKARCQQHQADNQKNDPQQMIHPDVSLPEITRNAA